MRKYGRLKPTTKPRMGAGVKTISTPPAIGTIAPARNIRAEANVERANASRSLPVTANLSGSKPQRRKRQKRNHARPFDRHCQLALMPGAVPGSAARYDLAALGDETLQGAHVL